MVAVCLTFKSMDCGDPPGVFTGDAGFLVFENRVRAWWWYTVSVNKFVIWSLGLVVSWSWKTSMSLQASMSMNNEFRGGMGQLSKYLRFWSLLILFSITADDWRESGIVSDKRVDHQSALITHSSSKYLLWKCLFLVLRVLVHTLVLLWHWQSCFYIKFCMELGPKIISVPHQAARTTNLISNKNHQISYEDRISTNSIYGFLIFCSDLYK